MALTEKLVAIANAIREKTSTEDKLTLEQMASAISGITTGGGGEDAIPAEISFTGTQLEYTFSDNKWKWILDNYSDRIKTSGLTSCKNIFSNTYRYTVDFPINVSNTSSGCSFYYAFYNCQNLTAINTPLENISDAGSMFYGCARLRELPNITVKTGGLSSGGSMFLGCRSLRKVPEEVLKRIYSTTSTNFSHPFTNMFQACSAIDEIKGLNTKGGAKITSNLFGNWGFGVSSSSRPQRLKEFTFATNDDGTPMVISWHSQTIDLSNIGVCVTPSYLTDYNSGITADKEVKNASDYERLKNDPDWFSGNKNFSRYSLQSAINTINSLPDTTEYLATQSGKTNTIKFNYNEGNPDGGKIGDMPEEIVAVAATKGWTVTITQQ